MFFALQLYAMAVIMLLFGYLYPGFRCHWRSNHKWGFGLLFTCYIRIGQSAKLPFDL